MAKISIKKLDLTDPYINNVSLFLPFNSNFNDSSSNNFSVTAYGNAQISSTQSKFGGSSAYFDGDGDYLEVSDNNLFNFGNGDFTIEFWIYFSGNPSPIGNLGTLVTTAYPSDCQGIYIGIGGYGQIQWLAGDGSNWYFARDAGSPLTQNQWYHIAYVRNGSNLLLFLNGTEIDSYNIGSVTLTNSNNKIHIGGRSSYNQYYNGYIDDLRVTKGTARYTSNFLPRSILSNNNKLNIKKTIEGSQVSSLSGLSLWLKADAGVAIGGGNHVNTWADQSSNGNNAVGPTMKKPVYVANGINGKPTMSFNGSTELFQINNSNSLDVTNCSIYIVLQRNGNGTGNEVTFMKNGNTLYDAGRYWQTALLNGENSNFAVYTNDVLDRDSNTYLADGLARIMSFTFDGSTFNIYSNGIKTASYAQNGDINSSTGILQIGGYNASFNAQEYFNGYISEFIIFNRALTDEENLSVTNYLNSKYAIYSSSYMQNGKLKIKAPIDGLFAFWNLNESGGTRYDSSGNGRNLIETFGTVSSTTGKIGNCAYFNGTNGGGSTNSKLGSTSFGVNPNSDFSMSVWMKPRSFSGYQHIIGAPFQNGFYIGGNGSNLTFNLYNSSAYGINAPSTAFDTWHHYVFIREGDTLKLYADNIYIGSASVAGQSFSGAPVFSVGGGELSEYYFNGDIDALGLWTRPLTESEIASLYNGGNGIES
jgi:hypothetical protein